MKKFQTLLFERFKKNEDKTKMTALASGNLTTFAGIFGATQLTANEENELRMLLENYCIEQASLESDLKSLSILTVEVKAINNQAALLHGERIKKAKQILLSYKEGAFTAWLLTVYSNRQTPYNFLQYYEFYEAISKEHHPLIDAMPRQAVYTLASREGSLDKKLEVVKDAKGKSKHELLTEIREMFPIAQTDRRSSVHYLTILNALRKARRLAESQSLSIEQRSTIATMLQGLLISVTTGPKR